MPRNLLIRFANDNIDQTPELASTLQSSAIANQLELTVRVVDMACTNYRPKLNRATVG